MFDRSMRRSKDDDITRLKVGKDVILTTESNHVFHTVIIGGTFRVPRGITGLLADLAVRFIFTVETKMIVTQTTCAFHRWAVLDVKWYISILRIH
jgi:hypothetical protein